MGRSGNLFNGPYWLTAKFKSSCGRCGDVINRGDQAFYWPKSRWILCAKDTCGKQDERDQAAAAFDERQYQSQF